MSGGHYPINHTRSSQEFIAPRHRLPVIAPPRTPSPYNSNSSITHPRASHVSWMNKHNFASNYRENSGCFGHSVPRDYSSISRAHCNDESSARSNPNFSNPLGNSSFGGITTNESMGTKGDVQQESMDLSAGHHSNYNLKTTPSAKISVNGDVSSESSQDHVPVNPISTELSITKPDVKEVKKESAVSVIAANPALSDQTVEQKLTLPTSDKIHTPEVEENTLPSDNVEFALESMFQSDNRSPVSSDLSVISARDFKSPTKDFSVENVEKILKSPSPVKNDDDDNLSILEDLNNEKMTLVRPSVAKTSISENDHLISIKNDSSENMDSKSKKCDCSGKRKDSKLMEVKFSKDDIKPAIKRKCISELKLNVNTNKNNGTVKKEINDQTSSQEQKFPSSLSNVTSKNGASELEKKILAKNSDNNATEKTFTCGKESTTKNESINKEVRNEEITYVEVESELEKMFAGIEDTAVNSPDKDLSISNRQDLSLISSDAQNNLSSLSSGTPQSQITTSLFDNVSVPTKVSKKKASKKSKTTNSTVKSAKENKKSSNSVRESSSMDNATVKRVPVIHIEGSKENPISAQIINGIKLEEDDVSDGRTSAKRKLGKGERAAKKTVSNYTFKNYDPGTSDASWVCVFCNLCAHATGLNGETTGDLFGPYFIRTPEQINLDNESKRHSRKANHFEQVKKKQKRSLSAESGYMDSSVSEEQKLLEIWAHENCIVWASGVYLVGSKLIGLEEAVMEALNTICTHCSNKGASIGCRTRRCNSFAHYSCAVFTGWKLDTETFISTCSAHSVNYFTDTLILSKSIS